MSLLMTVTQALTDVTAILPADLPNPQPVQPPGTGKISDVMGWAKWVALVICILGLIGAGAMMAINHRRGESGEHVGKLGWILAGVIVISGATSLIGFISGA